MTRLSRHELQHIFDAEQLVMLLEVTGMSLIIVKQDFQSSKQNWRNLSSEQRRRFYEAEEQNLLALRHQYATLKQLKHRIQLAQKATRIYTKSLYSAAENQARTSTSSSVSSSSSSSSSTLLSSSSSATNMLYTQDISPAANSGGESASRRQFMVHDDQKKFYEVDSPTEHLETTATVVVPNPQAISHAPNLPLSDGNALGRRPLSSSSLPSSIRSQAKTRLDQHQPSRRRAKSSRSAGNTPQSNSNRALRISQSPNSSDSLTQRDSPLLHMTNIIPSNLGCMPVRKMAAKPNVITNKQDWQKSLRLARGVRYQRPPLIRTNPSSRRKLCISTHKNQIAE